MIPQKFNRRYSENCNKIRVQPKSNNNNNKCLNKNHLYNLNRLNHNHNQHKRRKNKKNKKNKKSNKIARLKMNKI